MFRRLLPFFRVSIAALLVSISLLPSQVAYADGGSISGRITTADGTPIPAASVFVMTSWSRVRVAQVRTRNDGTYTIGGLSSNPYLVYAVKAGFELKYYKNSYGHAEAVPVTVAAPAEIGNMDIALGPGGTVSGTVRNADGSSVLPRIMVVAEPWDGSAGVINAPTREDGSYTIVGLRYTAYRIWAGRGEVYGGDSRYVRQYYDGKALDQKPDQVVIGPDINPTGLDFKLTTGASMSGRITEDDGTTPISGARVAAYYYGTSRFVNAVDTAPDGTYILAGIPRGRFLLAASSPGRETRYYDGVRFRTNATPLAISSPDDAPIVNLSLPSGPANPPETESAWFEGLAERYGWRFWVMGAIIILVSFGLGHLFEKKKDKSELRPELAMLLQVGKAIQGFGADAVVFDTKASRHRLAPADFRIVDGSRQFLQLSKRNIDYVYLNYEVIGENKIQYYLSWIAKGNGPLSVRDFKDTKLVPKWNSRLPGGKIVRVDWEGDSFVAARLNGDVGLQTKLLHTAADEVMRTIRLSARPRGGYYAIATVYIQLTAEAFEALDTIAGHLKSL